MPRLGQPQDAVVAAYGSIDELNCALGTARAALPGTAEFSALGFLSGTLAAFGATAVGWVLARRLFSLQFAIDPWVWALGLVCGTVLVGLSGTLATRRVVNTPPIVSLRDD